MSGTHKRASRARIAVAVALSVIAHGIFGAVPDGEDARPRPLLQTRRGVHHEVSASSAILRRVAAEVMRLAWYASARRDAGAGRLQLGATLLRANAIDAYAEGAPFDLQAALVAYEARRARFRELQASEVGDVREATFTTFADLTYAGTPGGRMGDLILRGRGACEPLSHLVVSVLFDEGIAGAGFRYYGGAIGGVTHLAPVLRTERGDFDLMSGDRAMPGGVAFDPAELIEAYARAHGLIDAPPRLASLDAGVFGSIAATTTLSAGYPPNTTRFEGAFPLFAEQAMRPIAAPAGSSAAPGGRTYRHDTLLGDDFPHCTSLLRLASLDDVAIPFETPSGAASISVELAPRPEALERIAGLALSLEVYRDDEDPVVRIAALACLAGVYKRAARDFAVAGKDEIAARAARETRRAQHDGAALIAPRLRTPEARDALLARFDSEAPGESWALLFLPGGGDLFEEGLPRRAALADGAVPRPPLEEASSRILLAAALIVAPETRAATIRSLVKLSPGDRVEVMHEIFGAHDARRPWSSSYEITAPPGLEEDPFVQANAVFRRMAWAMWDADRPPLETLDALKRDLDAAPETDPLRAALFSYFVKNTIAHAVIKKRDRSVVDAIATWLRDNHVRGVERSIAVLDAMRASPRFDLQALADAMRDESRARARVKLPTMKTVSTP
jgi:hypothetical protein